MIVALDWVAASSIATAAATLVLALATFAAVRSANRAARVAERSLLASLRPLLYVAPGELGFWQGAIRDSSDALFGVARDAIADRRRIGVEVLYGDHELGQRSITLFLLNPRDDGSWLTSVARQWNVDRADPR